MTDTNTVYSNVTFVKTRKGMRETTSTPDETTYSEVKVSKIKAPSEPDANPCLNCPDGWKSFEGQCYYFSNNTLDFEKAREQCQQQGADLVKVSSKEEQKFLAAAVAPMITNHDRFWIGLTDSEEEGQWLWMDRSPLEESLKFWVSHEPDDWKKEDPENGEDCATLGERSGKAYCWYDRTCKYPLRSICEKPGMPGYLMCAGI
ncbi:C-type lectin domain family 4 member E [Takifugu flavidus]|uniref:C-type lectin domain family 4 member E n=1 Tax=Takifugu flavidus TaxID=433684 RepID=A0A5C6NDG5_9TELE|nr:C-type lectin domain family 4 member E [Takifugu flavidus]